MTTLSGAMEILLQAVMTELQKPGGDTNFCVVSLMPGSDVPYDYGQESCGGILWIRLTSAAPSVAFPAADITVDNCFATLAYPLEIGIMRPAPLAEVVNDQFILPTAAENAAATDRQILDMQAIYRAMFEFKANDEVEDLMPGSYTPRGPEGGVVGGVWTLAVGLD